MVKKFYVVKKGFKTGIFNNWNECKEQIDGYSGAIYKSFATYEEAYKFLYTDLDNIGKEKMIIDNVDKLSTEPVKAYVDGSYSAEHKVYSFGVVILYNNQIIRLSGKENDQDNLPMRNVAGELLGTMEAIKWAVENKIKKILIYYDYEGIEKWALGIWKTNKKGTNYYKEFINNMSKMICIEFIKVKAHTGVKFNEEADKLAKSAIRNIALNYETKKYERNTLRKEDNFIDKYRNIFLKIVNEDVNENTNNQYVTIFKGMYINDKKMKKVAKEIWKMEKRKISEIEKMHITLNIDEELVLIQIADVNKHNYNYRISL